MNILHIVTLILNVLTCTGQTLVMHVVEVISNEDVTIHFNISSSANLTRWTYVAGLTGTSLMSYQNGQCTVSPSDSFLSDSSRYLYACNSTSHQVTIHYYHGRNLNNHILACTKTEQPYESGSSWMFKTVQDGYQCNCYSTITFSTRDITEGENVTFICRVSSDVTYVNWNRNIGANTAPMAVQNKQCTTSSSGTAFLDNTSKYIYLCNSTVYQVTILNVSRSEHNDMYTCSQPTQQEGTGSNWIIKVKAPVISVTITPTNYFVNVMEHTTINFKCTTSIARPAASVYWYRHPNGNNNDITQITNNITTTTDYNDLSVTTSILRFVPTRQDNDTKIFCKANNSVNTSPARPNMKRLLNILYKAEDPYILLSNEYHVIENTPGTLSCSVKGGNPTPIISWSCNNFSPTNQPTINSNGNVTTTLTWTPSRSHEGTCTCTSQQPGFQDTSIIVSLVVLYPPSKPVLRVNGSSVDGIISFIEGTNSSVKCIADSKPSPDRYIWIGPKVTNTENIPLLRLVNIKKTDAGEYKCSAHNTMNTSNGEAVAGINSSSVNIVVLYPPAVLPMNSISKRNGTRLNVVCNFTRGMPETTSIRWTRDIDNREWSSATLKIESLEKSDTGIYTCTVSNVMKQIGDNKSYIGQHNQSIQLDVQYEAIISFSINGLRDKNVTVDEDTAVIVKCITEGNPIPVMTLNNGTHVLISRTSHLLEYNLSHVSCHDLGTYSCSARNELNVQTVVSSIDLIVYCSPRPIGDIDETILSGIGMTVEIFIEVIAYPVPSFTWWFQVNDQWKIIQTTDRRLINSSGLLSFLTIDNVNEDDFTSYKVIVKNSVGEMEHIYELRDGSPDMPTQLQYFETLSTSSSIQLAWDPGYNGGSTQIFYIKYKSTDESSWNYQTVSDDLEQTRIYTLTNLKDNMNYYIKVLASNQYGNSTESSLLIAKTKEMETTESSNLGLLIGGISGGLIVVVAIVITVCILIRRKMSNKEDIKQPSTRQTESTTGITNEPQTNTQYDDIEKDNEYEMINQDSSPSKPYSVLQENDSITQAESKKDYTYENTI